MNPRAKNFSCAKSLVASLALTATTFLAQAQQADTKALFDQVSNRLDLGGQVFGFVNVQGDYASLAAKAKELYGQAIKMADDEIPLPEDLDIEAILKELGFSNVSALGMSSIKVGDGFRNKAFLGINGEPQGLRHTTYMGIPSPTVNWEMVSCISCSSSYGIGRQSPGA